MYLSRLLQLVTIANASLADIDISKMYVDLKSLALRIMINVSSVVSNKDLIMSDPPLTSECRKLQFISFEEPPSPEASLGSSDSQTLSSPV